MIATSPNVTGTTDPGQMLYVSSESHLCRDTDNGGHAEQIAGIVESVLGDMPRLTLLHPDHAPDAYNWTTDRLFGKNGITFRFARRIAGLVRDDHAATVTAASVLWETVNAYDRTISLDEITERVLDEVAKVTSPDDGNSFLATIETAFDASDQIPHWCTSDDPNTARAMLGRLILMCHHASGRRTWAMSQYQAGRIIGRDPKRCNQILMGMRAAGTIKMLTPGKPGRTSKIAAVYTLKDWPVICQRCDSDMVASRMIIQGWRNWDCHRCGHVKPMRTP